MIEFAVNSADYWESRFEGDWQQAKGCERTRYFAQLLLRNLPSWLDEDIRSGHLSLCDWGCAEGEAVDAFRAHFPKSSATGMDRSATAIGHARAKFGEHFYCHDVLAEPFSLTFDVIATSNVLQYFTDPWSVLHILGRQTARHLVVLVPFREQSPAADSLYHFDDVTIGTHIDPDFRLSSCRIVDTDDGSQVLLTYSRTDHFPRQRAIFETAATPQDNLTGELERVSSLLEGRETELRHAARREAALRSDLEYWRAKTLALSTQVELQTTAETAAIAERRQLQDEIARLHEVQNALRREADWRAAAAAQENALLNSRVTELHQSLSWRITAPLRWIAKPFFSAPAPVPAPPGSPPQAMATPAETAAVPAPGPIETIILPKLRSARSVAIVPCAIPFSSALNQRPISFAKGLADSGVTVLFVEVWQCPEQAIHKAGEEVYPGVFSIPLYAFQPGIQHTFEENIGAIATASKAPRSYICTIPMAGLVELVTPLRAGGYHIHYDNMDDWEAIHQGDREMGHWYSVAVEREMLILADTVTAVSDKLAEKFASVRSDIEVVRNGYKPAALACPQFIAARAPLEQPKVIGYFGHLADAWFDWETVFYAAEKRPDLVFEIIGSGHSERSDQRMKAAPNIRYRGLVPQKDLHQHAAKWWAGMIPFAPSVLSAAVDPLKIYEYLHFGFPTVATGISGIAGYPLVEYAQDRESFVAALDRLPDRPDEDTLTRVAAFLEDCVWEARLAKLNRILSRPAAIPSLYAE